MPNDKQPAPWNRYGATAPTSADLDAPKGCERPMTQGEDWEWWFARSSEDRLKLIKLMRRPPASDLDAPPAHTHKHPADNVGCPACDQVYVDAMAAEEKARQETSGLRCKITGNPCGTDTVQLGHLCQCSNCRSVPATCPTCFSPKPGDRWCKHGNKFNNPHTTAFCSMCVECTDAFHKTADRYVAIVIKVPADWPTESETLEEAVAGVVKVNYSHVPGGIKITRIIPISEEIANKVWV